MKRLILTPILLLSIILSSCEENNQYIISSESIFNSGQEVFFEYYHINYAWGLSYDHWIIDNEGNVRVSKKIDSVVWVDESRLNQYKNEFDSVIYKIDTIQLNKYIRLIPDAFTGEVLSEEVSRADFGGMVFNCFVFDGNQFKTIVLSERSDLLDQLNIDAGAIEIYVWLSDLNREIYSD